MNDDDQPGSSWRHAVRPQRERHKGGKGDHDRRMTFLVIHRRTANVAKGLLESMAARVCFQRRNIPQNHESQKEPKRVDEARHLDLAPKPIWAYELT
jgi:hypothetical protein